MSAALDAKHPTQPINLRVRGDIRDLIDRAAQSQSCSRSDFMIEAARKAAEEALLEQTLIRVSPQSYSEISAILDRPPNSEGFTRLMNAKKLWE